MIYDDKKIKEDIKQLSKDTRRALNNFIRDDLTLVLNADGGEQYKNAEALLCRLKAIGLIN